MNVTFTDVQFDVLDTLKRSASATKHKLLVALEKNQTRASLELALTGLLSTKLIEARDEVIFSLTNLGKMFMGVRPVPAEASLKLSAMGITLPLQRSHPRQYYACQPALVKIGSSKKASPTTNELKDCAHAGSDLKHIVTTKSPNLKGDSSLENSVQQKRNSRTPHLKSGSELYKEQLARSFQQEAFNQDKVNKTSNKPPVSKLSKSQVEDELNAYIPAGSDLNNTVNTNTRPDTKIEDESASGLNQNQSNQKDIGLMVTIPNRQNLYLNEIEQLAIQCIHLKSKTSAASIQSEVVRLCTSTSKPKALSGVQKALVSLCARGIVKGIVSNEYSITDYGSVELGFTDGEQLIPFVSCYGVSRTGRLILEQAAKNAGGWVKKKTDAQWLKENESFEAFLAFDNELDALFELGVLHRFENGTCCLKSANKALLGMIEWKCRFESDILKVKKGKKSLATLKLSQRSDFLAQDQAKKGKKAKATTSKSTGTKHEPSKQNSENAIVTQKTAEKAIHNGAQEVKSGVDTLLSQSIPTDVQSDKQGSDEMTTSKSKTVDFESALQSLSSISDKLAEPAPTKFDDVDAKIVFLDGLKNTLATNASIVACLNAIKQDYEAMAKEPGFK